MDQQEEISNLRDKARIIFSKCMNSEKIGRKIERGVYNNTVIVTKEFQYWNLVKKTYLKSFRKVLYNIKNFKNELLERISNNEFKFSELGKMTHEQLAPKIHQYRKNECEKLLLKRFIGDTSLFDNYEGILICGKCRSKKTQYIELQTRSADEPSKKKCICLDCGHRWSFC